MIAGSWGKLSGKVWRIGHMGENAREEKLFRFFRAFELALKDFQYPLPASISRTFSEKL
jgi:aspartate aminotransferase-like enzyme